jgi:hypothetical protein
VTREQVLLSVLAVFLQMGWIAFSIWQQSRGYKKGHSEGYCKGLDDYAAAIKERGEAETVWSEIGGGL